MQLTYDSDLNIAYMRFRKKPAKVTTVEVSDDLNVDLTLQETGGVMDGMILRLPVYW